MKALLFLPAFLTILANAQGRLELSLMGQQHVSNSRLINRDRLISESGQSAGIRIGFNREKNAFQFSALYSRMNTAGSVTNSSELIAASYLPQRDFLRLQLNYRRNILPQKRVYPFTGIGLSGFLFDRVKEYSGDGAPLWPGSEHSRRDDLSLLFTPGIRCRLNSRFSADLETGITYFFLQPTPLTRNFAFYLGVAFNLVIRNKTAFSSEPGYNPTSE